MTVTNILLVALIIVTLLSMLQRAWMHIEIKRLLNDLATMIGELFEEGDS